MKQLLVIFLAIGLTANVFGVIAGSAHDFSGSGWTPDGRICVACHTPHNSDTTVPEAPIWNHELTTQTFTMYGTTLAGTSTDAQPNGVSRLCLSCHDGVTALDSFGGNTGSTIIGAAGDLGTDLSDDHPISINYIQANGLVDPTTASGITGGTTIQADMLYSNRVECSSCHDVHNKYNLASLLKKSNTGSALCLTCHAK